MQKLNILEHPNLLETIIQHDIIFECVVLKYPIYFSDEVDTACVKFGYLGDPLCFIINKQFFDSCSSEKQSFIIFHEVYHIILEHGTRLSNDKLSNIAQDIFINHTLCRVHGFKREQVDPENIYCWVDTVFKGEIPPDNLSSEEYYNLLVKEGQIGNVCLVDDHSDYQSGSISDAVGDLLGSMIEHNGKSDVLETLQDIFDENGNTGQLAGTAAGNLIKQMSGEKVKKKKKWESVIKKWSLKYLSKKEKQVYQWVHENRRNALMDRDLMIPQIADVEHIDNKKKVDVVFFLDTSGSCAGLAGRFWAAAKSLPSDTFNLDLCCFDTKVYNVSLEKGQLYGFGGTSFGILERYVKKTYTKKHPDAIFVLTDGYGDFFTPSNPAAWHWFLTPNNYKGYISSKSNIHLLADFE